MARRTIIYHVGGPPFHPVDQQAQEIARWLGDENYVHERLEGLAAFERLDNADLLVVMGLHWTGGGNYQPMQSRHQAAFENYVASGRPIIAHHGGIASYDDWPRFGELLGFAWIWGRRITHPSAITTCVCCRLGIRLLMALRTIAFTMSSTTTWRSLLVCR
jgi:hypothetical protein